MHRIGNVLTWATDIEQATIDQAQNAASLPFVAGPLALMPDAHIGMGATIGSVIPTEGAIIPAAIGVDIGCGMIAVRTDLAAPQLPDSLDPLLGEIARSVPAGVGQGHTTDRDIAIPDHFTPKQAATARKQYGSLGSGNHFVQVCLDETDQVWVVLHSGSRGIGNQLAVGHIDGAKKPRPTSIASCTASGSRAWRTGSAHTPATSGLDAAQVTSGRSPSNWPHTQPRPCQ